MRGKIEIPFGLENMFESQNLKRLIGSVISTFYDSKNHFYTELNEWGYLLHSEPIKIDTGKYFQIDDQNKNPLLFAHIVNTIAKYIIFIDEVYKYALFYGNCEVNLYLNSIYNESLSYGTYDYLDLVFQEKNAESTIKVYSSRIYFNLKDIITDLLHPIVWAFNQSHDSIQRQNVMNIVGELLKRNRFIE